MRLLTGVGSVDWFSHLLHGGHYVRFTHLYTDITNTAYIMTFSAAAAQASSFSNILIAKYTPRETHPIISERAGLNLSPSMDLTGGIAMNREKPQSSTSTVRRRNCHIADDRFIFSFLLNSVIDVNWVELFGKRLRRRSGDASACSS
jgi:hypothetical protein